MGISKLKINNINMEECVHRTPMPSLPAEVNMSIILEQS